MAEHALQIYLSAEQHLALKSEAQRSGRSMSGVIRALIDTYVLAAAPPTDLSPLAGSVKLGRPTNIAADRDRMLYDALRAVR
jgi:hypothetical protein